MFKKLFMLFKIGRKLSTSGAITSIYEIYDPPILIKILFSVIGFRIDIFPPLVLKNIKLLN